jgi:SAM-dependent methyltransferase
MTPPEALPEALRGRLEPSELDFLLDDLGLLPAATRTLHEPGPEGAAAALVALVQPGHGPRPATVEAVLRAADRSLAEDGALLLYLEGRRPEEELAAWRNGLWPLLHAGVLYDVRKLEASRRTLSGTTPLERGPRKAHKARSGSVLVLRRRVHAMGPDATVEKFDANASGWNGEPGGASYPHFRWMRRFVGCFEPIPAGARVLDFGCGAGWCGIEAALRFRASELCFFDPSPAMVEIAARNAREAGIERAVGRVGFGDAPPFPAGDEAPFDAVISSGVISFAPDADLWLEGLVRTVRPGGLLVIGDIQQRSKGMQRRRARKPLLPARELNALDDEDVRRRLEARGFEHLGGAGYQLTRPFPEAMHVNETRLHGALTRPLLWSNQLAAAGSRRLGVPGRASFDSWVMALRHAPA